MKKFIALVLCLTGSYAMADTSAVETFLYNGLSDAREVSLTTEKTRTEYRNVRVPSTCYRTEMRRRCTQSRPSCRQVCDRRGVCQTICDRPRRVCRNVPVSVPYRCMRNETRAVQVHDYWVETKARFLFDTVDAGQAINEKFTVKMNGEMASLSANGSKNYFLVLDKRARSERREPGVKYINLDYNVRLVSAERAKNVLGNGIQNVSLRNGVLNFDLGAGFNTRSFTQQIRIFKNRRLGTDTLLYNQDLSAADMNVQATNNASNITIDLNNLDVKLPSKMRVILDTKLNIDEDKILNKGEIKTSASSNWVFR